MTPTGSVFTSDSQNIRSWRKGRMERIQPNTNPSLDLLTLAENLACEKADGHLTILRFTTGWKVAIGTPSLFGTEGRDEVEKLKSHKTLAEALANLIANPVKL